jgi:hypothetical protein
MFETNPVNQEKVLDDLKLDVGPTVRCLYANVNDGRKRVLCQRMRDTKQGMGVTVSVPRAASRVSKGTLSPKLITAASYDLTLSSRSQGCV